MGPPGGSLLLLRMTSVTHVFGAPWGSNSGDEFHAVAALEEVGDCSVICMGSSQ